MLGVPPAPSRNGSCPTKPHLPTHALASGGSDGESEQGASPRPTSPVSSPWPRACEMRRWRSWTRRRSLAELDEAAAEEGGRVEPGHGTPERAVGELRAVVGGATRRGGT
jgi:hypothetical protein